MNETLREVSEAAVLEAMKHYGTAHARWLASVWPDMDEAKREQARHDEADLFQRYLPFVTGDTTAKPGEPTVKVRIG